MRVQIWRDDVSLLDTFYPASAGSHFIQDALPRADSYRYRLYVSGNGIGGQSLYSPLNWFGQPITGIVIWALGGNSASADELPQLLPGSGYTGVTYTTDFPGKYPLHNSLDAVFVCLGVYDQNHALSATEGNLLNQYLAGGGNVYMEGGDTWCYDPQTAAHDWFGVSSNGDGEGDLFALRGSDGSGYEAFQFNYSGTNNFIDRIEPKGTGIKILENKTTGNGLTILNSTGATRTIASSFPFAGLSETGNSTKTGLLSRYLQHFGLLASAIETGDSGEISAAHFHLLSNYPNPFNGTTVFRFTTPFTGQVQLEIFNILGSRVYRSGTQLVTAGTHQLNWDGQNSNDKSCASGTYLYRLHLLGKHQPEQIISGKIHLLR
jgi:hypothetical protein